MHSSVAALVSMLFWGCFSCSGARPDETFAPRRPAGSEVRPTDHEATSEMRHAGTESKRSPESAQIAPQNQATVAPSSPFRQVLEGSSGQVIEYQGQRLYSNEGITFDLASREVFIDCAFSRGHFLVGKSLYFAARMSPYSACPDAPFLLERAGKKWELRRFIDAHDVQMSEWIHGTTIAAVVPYRPGPPFGYELVKVAGAVAPPRPARGASDPNDPGRRCYSELQQPLSFHAFRTGEIMVVGGARCDLPSDESQELSDEELNRRYRPVVESFPKGSPRSTLFSLPFDELVSLLEVDVATLIMMGKVRGGSEEDAPFQLVLVSFDGKSVEKLEVLLEGAKLLVSGPLVATPMTSEGVAPTRPSPLSGVWLLSESSLRAATGEGEPLWLPAKCKPTQAWFEGTHAWVVCENGLYTTDADHAWIEIPETEGSSTCEALDPHPGYSVPGIYQKASVSGGCGREFEPASHPKPSRRPDKFGTEF